MIMISIHCYFVKGILEESFRNAKKRSEKTLYRNNINFDK